MYRQVVYGMPLKPGDRILTCHADYGSNRLALLQLRARLGIQLEVVPDTPEGDIDIDALEDAMRRQPKPALVAINHIPTGCGTLWVVGCGWVKQQGVKHTITLVVSVLLTITTTVYASNVSICYMLPSLLPMHLSFSEIAHTHTHIYSKQLVSTDASAPAPS